MVELNWFSVFFPPKKTPIKFHQMEILLHVQEEEIDSTQFLSPDALTFPQLFVKENQMKKQMFLPQNVLTCFNKCF